MKFRKPLPLDGPAITALIAACPPLDSNSAYCNLLQCTHFAQTCVVAERAGQIVGWVSGYRPPSEPSHFFVWQVAVAWQARGQRLAQRMITELLSRASVEGATHLVTTVTSDNKASWTLFEGFARRIGADLAKVPLFERDAHFAGAHDTEWQVTIGPFPADFQTSFQDPETSTP